MMRYYFKIKYKYNPVEDSEYYKEAAKIMLPVLMRCSSDEVANAKICISVTEKLSIDELKKIVCHLWQVVPTSTGWLNGFNYSRLRPDSFTVTIDFVEEKHICQTAIDICKLSDKIIESFARQDNCNIFCISDSYHREIESQIALVADCLN